MAESWNQWSSLFCVTVHNLNKDTLAVTRVIKKLQNLFQHVNYLTGKRNTLEHSRVSVTLYKWSCSDVIRHYLLKRYGTNLEPPSYLPVLPAVLQQHSSFMAPNNEFKKLNE